MAVTIVKDPTGHKLIDDAISAAITDSAGDAMVTLVYHGLGTGDSVYVTSDIDEYNGFWYVTAIDANTFKLSEYAAADFVPYYQDAEIEYYVTADHVWSSIFLPIVYKIQSDKWPINTIDTARTISSVSNDNGYAEVYASGVLNSDIHALDYVKISNTDDLDGTYQVIEVIGTSHVVLDLAYDSSLVGATIQYYYNNYHVKVKVFAGLPSGHPWAAKKPMEEMAELSFVPDENGIVMFSVADYIRGKVDIKNNLTLYSLPLNLDAFTAYYISTAEAYDASDSYTITTEESDFETDDRFTGYAVAGKLPFKNTYAGDYSEYVFVDGEPGKWLASLERLLAVEDKYFDVSFIKNVQGPFQLVIDKYVSDYLTTTETIDYEDQGIGVYRLPIEVDAAYDSFCIRVVTSGETTDIELPALSDWRTTVGSFIEWTEGAAPVVTLTGVQFSENLWAEYDFIEGGDYTIDVHYTLTSLTSPVSIALSIYGSDLSLTHEEINSDVLFTTGAKTISLSFTAGANYKKVALSAAGGLGKAGTFTINSTEATETLTGLQLTEEICIDIIESCEATGGFTPTDIRVLEDGSYRLLE